ncbi:lysophospholipid acyltransferase family protein [Gaoshiqia sp. Z1-71]|uniref:lysophospholipid acyltransferase family protein n=1 Tax=Gaoshiqia hydrogeniformans TaxID=3290090 RepID=UPI003BF79792
MKKILNRSVVLFLKALGRLPFSAIYLLSDFLFVVIYHLIGYRRKVVYANLHNSFPEKGEPEIKQIARNYYRHFCDLFLESLKLGYMTEKQLDERIVLLPPDQTEAYYRQGKSFIALGMHYNNWEWSCSMQRKVSHQVVVVFNPLRNNPEMDNYLRNIRERFGSQTIPMQQAARKALQFNSAKRPGSLVLAADQTPPQNAQFWTTFLNQETPFFAGPVKIAIKTNQPVFFHLTRKLARGKYQVELIELIPEPAKVSEETILLAYVNMMEKYILETPEYWLWSHRRWKHKRPEHIPLIERKKQTD